MLGYEASLQKHIVKDVNKQSKHIWKSTEMIDHLFPNSPTVVSVALLGDDRMTFRNWQLQVAHSPDHQNLVHVINASYLLDYSPSRFALHVESLPEWSVLETSSRLPLVLIVMLLRPLP